MFRNQIEKYKFLLKFIRQKRLTFPEVQEEYIKLSDILMGKGLSPEEAYEVLGTAYNVAIHQKPRRRKPSNQKSNTSLRGTLKTLAIL